MNTVDFFSPITKKNNRITSLYDVMLCIFPISFCGVWYLQYLRKTVAAAKLQQFQSISQPAEVIA